MNHKDLIFGVGDILRERVSGWASSNGTNHVYPDHPPLDLAKSSYPRATVDTVSYAPTGTDIENDIIDGNVLVDVTVYGVNSGPVNQILSESIQAMVDYHDQNNSDGNPYLDNFSLITLGIPSPLVEEDTDKGWTRYNKTQEFQFEAVTLKTA